MIYINKEIEDKRAWSDGFILDDIQFENSILDFKISTEGGYIICPIDVSSKYRKFKAEEKIYIPKIICSLPITNQYGSRIIYLSKLQKLYNALVRCTNTINITGTTYGKKHWLSNILSAITKEIKLELEGKGKWIYKIIYSLPIQFSGRAVLVPDIQLDVEHVKIPRRVAQSWMKNPEFITKFDLKISPNYDNNIYQLIDKYIIIGRQPTHTIANILCMKIGGFTEDVISIHPSITPMMHGDHDGDQLWFGIVKNHPKELVLDNLISEFFIPDKEYEQYGYIPSSMKELRSMVTDCLIQSLCNKSITPNVPESYPGYDPGDYQDGITKEEFLKIDGALSYRSLKHNVGISGGIGNTLVALSICNGNQNDQKNITKLRHSLAQNSLDLKHGSKSSKSKVLMNIQQLIYNVNTKTDKIILAISKLEPNADIIDSLYNILKNTKGDKITNVIQEKYPEYYAATKQIKSGSCLPIINGIIKNYHLRGEE